MRFVDVCDGSSIRAAPSWAARVTRRARHVAQSVHVVRTAIVLDGAQGYHMGSKWFAETPIRCLVAHFILKQALPAKRTAPRCTESVSTSESHAPR